MTGSVKRPGKQPEIDLSKFPAGSVSEYSTLVCLACPCEIFTAPLGMAPRPACSEIKRYTPTVPELTAPNAVRPFFDSEEKHPHCTHCQAAKRWHARFETLRIEGGKQTDAGGRELLKALSKKDEQFQTLEAKSERRAVFFEWLDALRLKLDFADDGWLIEATREFLARRDSKTNWAEIFTEVRAVRRSNRLTENWERDGNRLFLAPSLYNDVLLVQYLVSRSQQHGGSTFAGRLTLLELTRRFRHGAY